MKKKILIVVGALISGLIIVSGMNNKNNQSVNNFTSDFSNSEKSENKKIIVEKTPEVITLNGIGQQASNKFQLQKGLSIFKMTHNGSSNFIVNLLDSNGKQVGSLVNEIDSFNGGKAENIQESGTYILDVTADGNWTVIIEQPRQITAPDTTSFSGKGQQTTKLFYMKSGLKTIKMTHNGSSNFIVSLLDSNGKQVDGLVNEIGSFNGSKAEGVQDNGIYLFDIAADGDWSIDIER